MIERKRLDLVVEALSRLADDCRLTIAGEGPMADPLRDLVRSLGLDRRVEFVGYVEPADLPEILGRCDTLVLPSQKEVYGLVVTEALAAGLHVVVSERAGVANVVRGMRGAWVVAPRLDTLVDGMQASAEAWSGPIASPAVLGHTPEAMATSITEAAQAAMTAQRRPGERRPVDFDDPAS